MMPISIKDPLTPICAVLYHQFYLSQHPAGYCVGNAFFVHTFFAIQLLCTPTLLPSPFPSHHSLHTIPLTHHSPHTPFPSRPFLMPFLTPFPHALPHALPHTPIPHLPSHSTVESISLPAFACRRRRRKQREEGERERRREGKGRQKGKQKEKGEGKG
jgi:hypothetical protein